MKLKPDPAVVALNSRAFAERVKIGDVCRRAKVSPQTWSRWAAGGMPAMQKLRDMESALDEILAEESAQTAGAGAESPAGEQDAR